jgi:hypothetical protein
LVIPTTVGDLIVNWGYTTGIGGSSSSGPISFDQAFSTSPIGALVTADTPGANAGSIGGLTTSAITIQNNKSVASGYFWLAWGY